MNMHLSVRSPTAPCSNIVPPLPTLWGLDMEHDELARWCIVAIISELHQNTKTVLVSESCSTPSGCSWPKPTHNWSASYYVKRLEHNRLLLPWLATSMLIQFPISVSSPRVRSISAEVVAVDVVDILMWDGNQGGQFMQGWERAWDVRLRKILQFTTDTTIFQNSLF